MVDLSQLATEAVDPTLAGLDTMPTGELVRLMINGDRVLPDALSQVADQIEAAVDGVAGRLQAGGRLIYAGAGTSGRLGILDASEIPPTYGTSPDLVQAVIAGGPTAIRSSVEDAEDEPAAGADDLRALRIGAADAVVGIAASGRTPYVLGALAYAREVGAFTVGVTANAGSEVGRAADVAVEVVTGPEFVAGSTRLRAGTAQKMVLNMISTLAMVRLGKTYGNLMVDVQASNAKLRARAIRIVGLATGVDADRAAAALAEAGGSVKEAILIIETGLDVVAARTLLAEHDGFLRAAIEAARPLTHPLRTSRSDVAPSRRGCERRLRGAECGQEGAGDPGRVGDGRSHDHRVRPGGQALAGLGRGADAALGDHRDRRTGSPAPPAVRDQDRRWRPGSACSRPASCSRSRHRRPCSARRPRGWRSRPWPVARPRGSPRCSRRAAARRVGAGWCRPARRGRLRPQRPARLPSPSE